jgi:hypothetical protein
MSLLEKLFIWFLIKSYSLIMNVNINYFKSQIFNTALGKKLLALVAKRTRF